jgi:adenosylhomocysteine nucleosidase
MTGWQVDTLGSVRVAFAMATAHEYGPALQRRIRPLITGVGPIEASLSVGIALQRMARLPDLVVCLGSAGSRARTLGAVYQVASVSWRDMDASALGFPRGVTPFSNHPAIIALPLPIHGVPSATLSTGADVVTGEAYARIAADMVDMETFAVWRACERFGVPMAGLRGISDGPSDVGGLLDWTALLGLLDIGLANAVDLLAQSLSEGGGTAFA